MRTGLLLLLIAAGGAAQAVPERAAIEIEVDKDMTLRRFVTCYGHVSERVVLRTGCAALDVEFGVAFRAKVRRRELRDIVRAVLAFYEISILPVPGAHVDVLYRSTGLGYVRVRRRSFRMHLWRVEDESAPLTLRFFTYYTVERAAATAETHARLLATVAGIGGAVRADAVRLLALAPRDRETVHTLFLAATDPDPRVQRAAWSLPLPLFTTD